MIALFFSLFFRKLNQKYVNTNFEPFLSIELYLSWDKKKVVFACCEISSGSAVPVRTFGYFGALKSFKQSERDDFKGNFVSFGNDLQGEEKYAIIPPMGQSSENQDEADNNLYNIVGNKITVNAYGLDSYAGSPYPEYVVSTYSDFEFNRKTEINYGISSIVRKSPVSKIVLSHSYENERGYLDRVLATTKYGRAQGQKSYLNAYTEEEIEYIYIDLIGDARNIFSNSNRIIRGIYLRTD